MEKVEILNLTVGLQDRMFRFYGVEYVNKYSGLRFKLDYQANLWL